MLRALLQALGRIADVLEEYNVLNRDYIDYCKVENAQSNMRNDVWIQYQRDRDTASTSRQERIDALQQEQAAHVNEEMLAYLKEHPDVFIHHLFGLNNKPAKDAS